MDLRCCKNSRVRSALIFIIAVILFLGCQSSSQEDVTEPEAQQKDIQEKASAYPQNPVFEESEVYVSGTGGYDTYRIPSLIATQNGTLLAFCEGRKAGAADAGNMDLLLRRSEDGGQTWSEPQVIWDDGENFCGNPCAVIDEQTGTIWLLMIWKNGKDEEWMIHLGIGKDTSRVFSTYSGDDGKTWAEPTEITAMVKSADWRWYATGPGIGIQLKYGEHKGRLVIPCNHSTTMLALGSHAIFSDDHGQTWSYSNSIPGGCDEAQVVERIDGTLEMNMRMQRWSRGYRAISLSMDDGETWSWRSHDTNLPDPKCQASIIRYTTTDDSDKNRLLFSNPATGGRNGMTVRMSYDEGKTWPVAKLIFPGSSAYSCLTVLKDKTIGLLYEKDNYGKITFAHFDLLFLTEGRDSIE